MSENYSKVVSSMKQLVDNEYEDIFLAPEQRFVKPLQGSESVLNNLEEQYLLGVESITRKDKDEEINKEVKIFSNYLNYAMLGEQINGIPCYAKSTDTIDEEEIENENEEEILRAMMRNTPFLFCSPKNDIFFDGGNLYIEGGNHSTLISNNEWIKIEEDENTEEDILYIYPTDCCVVTDEQPTSLLFIYGNYSYYCIETLIYLSYNSIKGKKEETAVASKYYFRMSNNAIFTKIINYIKGGNS